MEVSDRLGEREAEPRAFVRAAGIEAAETPTGFIIALNRNAGAAISDLHADLMFTGFDTHANLAAGRAVADGILDEIAHRLR